MIRVDVAYALIYKPDEEKILMVKNSGRGWSLPGGAVEQGETFEQAILREVKEKTNLTVEIGDIVAVNKAVLKEVGHHALFLTFNAKVTRGEISIIDKVEILAINWVKIHRANELCLTILTGSLDYSIPHLLILFRVNEMRWLIFMTSHPTLQRRMVSCTTRHLLLFVIPNIV